MYYCHSSKCTGKETGKTHLCGLWYYVRKFCSGVLRCQFSSVWLSNWDEILAWKLSQIWIGKLCQSNNGNSCWPPNFDFVQWRKFLVENMSLSIFEGWKSLQMQVQCRKVPIFWEGLKILWNLHLTLVYSTFCGLLKIY